MQNVSEVSINIDSGEYFKATGSHPNGFGVWRFSIPVHGIFEFDGKYTAARKAVYALASKIEYHLNTMKIDVLPT